MNIFGNEGGFELILDTLTKT